MPVGIQRLNAKKSQPNDRIIFIKPLKGPDEATAQDFLERIAAQCLPIMREHHLSVMTLEEHEPNREFVGRNFNAGEIIQLVLKARGSGSGRWLPFDYVQMVMMHELAHCVQMNHSRAFWVVRNTYADEMRRLWGRGYTGDGLWGRGALLTTGEWERDTARLGDADMPEHLCGGTYRSRGRKRKAKKTLSYQEQKERRILKRFGANGVALGGNAAAKAKLEKGRRVAAAPRVAGSKRGRDLRAAAALARFGEQQQKKDEQTANDTGGQDEEGTASGSETGSESDEDGSSAGDGTIRVDGARMVDGKGATFVRVCGDEDLDDEAAARELEDLQSSMRPRSRLADEETPADSSLPPASGAEVATRGLASVAEVPKPESVPVTNTAKSWAEGNLLSPTSATPQEEIQGATICGMCSFTNDDMSVTCSMCSNVLDPAKVPDSWKCQFASCQESSFINAGDCAVCGACGQRRPSSSTAA